MTTKETKKRKRTKKEDQPTIEELMKNAIPANDIINNNPTLKEQVEKVTPIKEWLVTYVGEKYCKNGNKEVNVNMVVEALAIEFPEFILGWIKILFITNAVDVAVEIIAIPNLGVFPSENLMTQLSIIAWEPFVPLNAIAVLLPTSVVLL